MLVIEDDRHFAKVLLGQCREKGFKCLVSATGQGGLNLSEKFPLHGVILDIKLPGMDGLAVLEMLKDNPKTRHIPVHVISVEEASMDALRRGALGFLKKPANKKGLEKVFRQIQEVIEKKIKDLLVVEDNLNLQKSISDLIESEDVRITRAETGDEAFKSLTSYQYDCMVLDLGLPDMTGFQLLEKLEKEKGLVMAVRH